MSNDGGPAFPTVMETHPASTGMSLRDWFAGQALIAVLQRTNADALPADYCAEVAYRYADAMLAERAHK